MSTPQPGQQAQTAATNYNRLSRVYGFLSDSSEATFVHTAIDEVLQPQPGWTVLEPGFGTGQVLVALAERVGPEGKVTGLDVSTGMAQQATKRVARANLVDRVELTVGSATQMPYEDDAFDAVFMSFTLELFPDALMQQVLTECARVLSPQGYLCVACMSKRGKQGTMMKLYEWSHRRFPTFVDCRPIQARSAITAAGFTIDEVRELSMWGLPVDIILARLPHESGEKKLKA